MIDKNKIADRLKSLRVDSGYTQRDLSKLLGVSIDTAVGWDNARTLPRHDKLLKLSKLYDVSIDYMLVNTNRKEINK